MTRRKAREHRSRNLIGMLTALPLVVFAGAPAHADHLPSTFSIDVQGPTVGAPDSFVGAPITGGDILTTAFPFGPPGPNPTFPFIGIFAPGTMVGAGPGAPGIFPGGLGLFPGLCADFSGIVIPEVDALSYGFDSGFGATEAFWFSVDEWATGDGFPAPPSRPDVNSEGAFGAAEASADLFQYLGLVVATPPVLPGTGPGNLAHEDGDGIPPSGAPGFGLFEPNPFGPGVPDPGDNLDAYDSDTAPLHPAGPVYFSLDSIFPDPLETAFPPPNCGTAAANGFSGADVLVSFPGGFPALFIPAPTLGLDAFGPDTDDLDALAYLDADGDGLLSPPDAIYFSVRRSSAVVGAPDSAFGAPIEPGDILTLPVIPGGVPAIAVSAEALGLGTVRSGTAPLGIGDDLDALDLALCVDMDADGICDDADNCILPAPPGALPGQMFNPLQDDTDGDGCGNVCDPDFSAPVPGNGTTNVFDVLDMLPFLGLVDPAHDLTNPIGAPSVVNVFDVFVLLHWLNGPPPGLPSGPSGTTLTCP